MRWNETCTLVAKAYALDDEGVPQPKDDRKEVFCNPRTVGASTWSSMYEIGISPDAQVQLRSCDYDGQRDVLYGGTWYSVEFVQQQGDLCVLTLRHQKSDSDDEPDYGNGGDGDGQ
jgi:hypothetical protein